MNVIWRAAERTRELRMLSMGRLRALLLAFRGARVGKRVYVGPRCRIDRPWSVTLEDRSWLEADVFLKVVSDDAELVVGACAFLGRGVELDVSRSVSIGARALLAPGCFVTDHAHRISSDAAIDEQGCEESPVTIGMGAWLGAGSVILPGVRVGDGAVVGAQAVVRENVPSLEIVGGVPARSLGRRRSERA